MYKKFLPSFIISLTVWTVLALLFYFGLFASWQNKLSDSLFTPKKPLDNMVIIAIDDTSIQRIGRWPWTRTTHAKLLTILAAEKPESIGIDISFLEPENNQADTMFQHAIDRAGNVILASEVVNGQILKPIYTAKTGIVNTVAGSDGITRHALFTSHNTPHFTRQILGGEVSPPLENNLLRINFAGPPNTFPTYSYVDVLEGNIFPQTFKNKIVLIGATAPDLHDEQIVPVSGGTPMSGVEIQANIAQTLIGKNFLTPERTSATLLVMAVLSFFVATSLRFLGMLSGICFIFLILAGYLLFSVFSFDDGIIRNLIFPPLAILTTGIADLVYKYFSEYRQKHYIKKALSFYLSKPVMNQILSSPEKLTLGGERQELTVLFSDIAGFTTISEKLRPEILSHLLNQYLTSMTNIVFKYNGVLDKYIGDAVMAFWGAPIKDPNHARAACLAALEMQTEIQKIEKDWQKAGIEQFHARIGINTGDMVVGNMGSDVRFDYTLLGDNVNLGSRLEGINKVYGTRSIISGTTLNQVNDGIARQVDVVAVKGKQKGVAIFELRGVGIPSDQERTFLAAFEAARLLYEQGKFKKALNAFQSFHKKYPDDGPTHVYLDRCKEFSAHPPAHWDGIYHATSK